MSILTSTRYKITNLSRAARTWGVPWIRSVLDPDGFRPILGYLFTDWNCNISCHYCWQSDNRSRPVMELDRARQAIDWLKTTGCRVLALMGGEPLLRKDFTLRVIEYGVERGFYVYLPTNGYLMDRAFIDEAGAAGVAAVNLAVDAVAPKNGLPKALLAIEPQFRYLVERQTAHGYVVFLNINITGRNLRDVRMLTEIAHDNAIATDYHLTEPPHGFVDTAHYRHADNDLSIKPEQYAEADALIDWLLAAQRSGYTMVNSRRHLELFKRRMRGQVEPWACRAGKNGVVIRIDGSLTPCFDLMTHDGDWGRVGEPRMEPGALAAVKAQCSPACSSTCFYNLADYYHPWRLTKWVAKHAMNG